MSSILCWLCKSASPWFCCFPAFLLVPKGMDKILFKSRVTGSLLCLLFFVGCARVPHLGFVASPLFCWFQKAWIKYGFPVSFTFCCLQVVVGGGQGSMVFTGFFCVLAQHADFWF